MLRKDFIVRQAEEFGRFLGIILALRKTGNWQELERVIRTNASKYTSVEVEFSESLPDENFAELLVKKNQLSGENLKMLGDLLYEKSIAYLETGDEVKAKNALTKSFLLFNYVKNNALDSEFSLDMHYKMETIKRLLSLK
jgi:hypothetical protein